MRICYENYLDSSIISVSPTEDSNYPLSNVQDQRLTTTWKALVATAQTISIDLGSAKSITTCAIISHNIATATTVVYQGGTTSAATTSSVFTVIYNANMMLNFISSNTYRYWKISISNNAVPVEIGRIYLGNYITIDPSSLLDFSITKKHSDNIFHNNTRQKYASQGNMWREFNFKFPPSNEAMLKTVSTMFDYCRNANSLIFCNFDTDRNYSIVEPVYCSINGTMEFTQVDRDKFEYNLSLEEEL